MKKRPLAKFTKGKVIIAFLIGCGFFLLAWSVSKVTSGELLSTVQNISAPNEKLRLVNGLYHKIIQLDQHKRAEAVTGEVYSNDSAALQASMDSLKLLYHDDAKQLKRIDSMKSLLAMRDSLFTGYKKQREELVNNEVFSSRLDSLPTLISIGTIRQESTMVKTERKRSTTVIPIPAPENADNEKDEKRGFFARLLGSKKKPEASAPQQEIIREEVDIKVDTVIRRRPDTVYKAVSNVVRTLKREHKVHSSSFIDREAELASSGNQLTNQVLSILKDVEKEVIDQSERNGKKAVLLVDSSIKNISYIMLTFLGITSILFYMIITDISRSNTYRARLEEAKNEAEFQSMARQKFLSSMSHEIRTPLQSILGYSELIKEQEKPKKKDIEAIYYSSNHLLNIVNEILDYSRIISGKYKFEKQSFNIYELLKEVITIMMPQAELKSLKLTLAAEAEDEFVTGDPFRLKQVLFNLLGNAIKFTDRGEVTLYVTRQTVNNQANYSFYIKDSGCGISKEELPYIFNEFERASNLNSHQPGTGLGLSIVKTIVEAMGGTIGVESTVGEGSVFTLRLNFDYGSATSAVEQAEEKQFNFQGKVWLIDDDRFILDFCSSVLSKHQVRHQCFHVPKTMIAAAKTEAPDIVLMDMRMPGLSGIDLIRILKEHLPDNVRYFAVTAQALPEEREVILKAGFDDVLMKPFRERELLALLTDSQVEAAPEELPAAGDDSEKEAFAAFPDYDTLAKITFGDKELMSKILDRFVEDSGNDIEAIRSSISNSDKEQLILTMHRVAGRTAQLGAKDLAGKFRTAEIALRESNIGPEHQAELLKYTEELDELIQQVQSREEPSGYSI